MGRAIKAAATVQQAVDPEAAVDTFPMTPPVRVTEDLGEPRMTLLLVSLTVRRQRRRTWDRAVVVREALSLEAAAVEASLAHAHRIRHVGDGDVIVEPELEPGNEAGEIGALACLQR